MADHPAQFRVLFVCTGNICRSPMAQAMLVHRLRNRLGADRADATFDVTSAGTGALAGHPLEDDALVVLTELGVTPDPFAARDVDETFVQDADLVLTATRAHRAAVVSLVPRVVRRAFTLREFARLAAAVDVDALPADGDVRRRLAALVDAAAANRGYVRADAPEDDDVADPYRQPIAAFRAAGAQIDQTTTAIAELFARCVDSARG